MNTVLALNPLSANDLLSSFGTIGVLVVLFAETGLLIGFFLPGDSLLFTAGLLAATGAGRLHLSLPWVLLAAAAGALVGAQVGFLIGRRAGHALQQRARIARRIADGMRRAEELFARYGPAKAIVLARFIPVVRTVLNPVAGALHTPLRTFTLWQVVGGLVWTVGLVLAGYALGRVRPRRRRLPAARDRPDRRRLADPARAGGRPGAAPPRRPRRLSGLAPQIVSSSSVGSASSRPESGSGCPGVVSPPVRPHEWIAVGGGVTPLGVLSHTASGCHSCWAGCGGQRRRATARHGVRQQRRMSTGSRHRALFSSHSHHRLPIVMTCAYWSWRTSCGWRPCSSAACRRTGTPSTWPPPARTRSGRRPSSPTTPSCSTSCCRA